MSTGKGKKRVRNQPVLHETLKKQRGVWLTDTAWEIVQQNAVKNKVSCSEYLENLIRQNDGS